MNAVQNAVQRACACSRVVNFHTVEYHVGTSCYVHPVKRNVLINACAIFAHEVPLKSVNREESGHFSSELALISGTPDTLLVLAAYLGVLPVGEVRILRLELKDAVLALACTACML